MYGKTRATNAMGTQSPAYGDCYLELTMNDIVRSLVLVLLFAVVASILTVGQLSTSRGVIACT